MGRALIRKCLANSEYDAVYSLINPGDDKGDIEGNYITKPISSSCIPRSLYRPVLWGKNISTINAEWRRILLVGLPCQIKAAKRYLADKYKDISVTSVALLCRQNKTFQYSDYVAKSLGIEKGYQVDALNYRGTGWPGYASYQDHKCEYVVRPFVRKLWQIPGCRYCTDCLAANIADIVLTDPWGVVSPCQEGCGKNLIYVFTEAGMSLLSETVNLEPLGLSEGLAVFDAVAVQEKELYRHYMTKKISVPVLWKSFFYYRDIRVRVSQELFWKLGPKN